MSELDVLIDECLCVKCESGIGPCDNIASRDAARAELAALRSELDDWRNSARMVSGEMCGDEKHCTCVPLLRNRIAKLEAALAKADEVVYREDELLELRDDNADFVPTGNWFCMTCYAEANSREAIQHVGRCAAYRAAREQVKP